MALQLTQVMKLSDDDTLSTYYSSEKSFDVSLGEIYSDKFINELNRLSDKMPALSDYSNELFLYFLYPMTEYRFLLEKYEVKYALADKVGIKQKLFLYEAIRLGVNVPNKNKLLLHGSAILKILILPLSIFFSSLIISLMLFVRSSKLKITDCTSLAVIRSAQVEKKLSFLKNDPNILFFSDDFFSKNRSNSSLFDTFNFKEKALSFIKVPFLALKDLYLVWLESRKLFGLSLTSHIIFHYLIRIPHKSIFEYSLSLILKKGHYKTLITGNKEDRFAVCESRLAKMNSLRLLCYPHGLEYAMKVPHGLPGDVFYCTSNESYNHLKNIYINDKFIFDQCITKKMLSIPKTTNVNIKKIVFFTESREIDVNRKIISTLKACNVNFIVKLHPKDTPDNYKDFSLEYISSFDDAIVGNICLARKSTVLVESLYNDSIPVAVLIDGRDKAMYESLFPSLTSPDIKRLCTDEELKKFVTSVECEN